MSVFQSKSIVYPQSLLNAILGALTVVPGAALLTTPKVGLWTDPAFLPTPSNVLADFTASEATFSGYSQQTLTLAGPVNLTTLNRGVIAPVSFLATAASPFVPNTVYGYFVTSGAVVYLSEKFPAGFTPNFGAPGDWLDILVAFPQVGLAATQ